jgi:hypothetical protein
VSDIKERPILFSAPMVRAILDGSKTQTRRAFRDSPPPGVNVGIVNGKTPYGAVGDRLWVREAWKAHTTFDHLPPRDIPQTHVWYMADDGYKAESRFRQSMFMPRWASRITLEVTGVRVERLNEISETDALAEGICTVRTQEWDLEHFGAWRREFDAACQSGIKPPVGPAPASSYRALWEQINGPGSWAANPWVWVVEFKVIKP